MDHDLIRHLAIAGGLATIGTLGGTFAAAMSSFSRSRLEDMLRERDEQMSSFLKSIVDEEKLVSLTASLWHALAIGAFLVYAGVVWIAPAIPAASNGSWHPLVLSSLLLLFIAGILRAAAALVGDAAPERLISAAAGPACILTYPLRPLARAILAARTVIVRGLGHEPEKTEDELEEEVMAAVSDGVLDEVVAEEQKEMIESIFDLKDDDVADVLTPRTDMVSIEAGSTLSQAIAIALDKGHSRLPVHEETRDNIIGIFYVRDALQYWDTPGEKQPSLREILRKPVFVPETKKISELLHDMRRNKVHLCVVLDEYGGTAGLVTIEDVLEQIVGEIQDEYDQGEETIEVKVTANDTVEADGQAHVHEINEAFDDDIIPEDDDYETIGGFVLDELGHIPVKGESFTYKSLRLEVLDADERKVNRVRLHYDRDYEEE